MPTGYTAAVQDGRITELEPFAWQLARGMGALIMMRDEPWDAPVPKRFEPSQYNATALTEARAERDRLYAMSDEEAQAAADAELAEWEADRAASEQKHRDQRARYLAMIDKLEAWQGAPEGIKEFGLEQLRQSLDFDCREPFKYWSEPPARDGAEWRRAKLAKVAKDIDYHAREQAAEEARTEGRNAWLAQLRKSLAQVGTHPQGRDATQARGDSLSDAVANADAPAPDSPPHSTKEGE